ncbi:uncharacterized protein LOC107805889 [Nicotiana tabacum]|uniref:Uncharacterized protein LOC107805889 n=1 Tax=Nicotiana tabacum TaxID=4097 RepID=A0A1S4B9F6_TOBAC|nr:PREDICTED: uncharacterized protein LOC107805889 [Nicotiana tabacum]XP_018633844.1 uncharacterized protein LOC104118620 isoform X2 [Nicotiana tomentosiformis]
MEKEERRKNIMEKGSDGIAHLSSASLEGVQDYEIEQLSQPNSSDLVAGVESQVQNSDGEVEAKGATASQAKNEVESLLVKPSVAKASEDAEVLPRKRNGFLHLFSLRDINSCILISENKRVICSVMISFLVVLSYAHLPHSIARSNSFIASRPLYILLLTDLTIVIARIIRKEVVPDEERREDRQRVNDFGHNWDGALTILEYGLVLYQTIRAIFIDCSFYLVIVICGLSLI